MTSPFDEVERRTRFGPRCTVGAALADMDPGRRKETTAALGAAYRHATISRVLRDWGYRVGPLAVARHRRRECLCDGTHDE
jgi:hypothetical protein